MGFLLDPVAVVTGLALGLIFLDMRPGRVPTALFLLAAFIGIAIGANFEIDVRNGAWSAYVKNITATVHYMDDKPAKLALELSRTAGAIFWLLTARFGIPAFARLLKRSEPW